MWHRWTAIVEHHRQKRERNERAKIAYINFTCSHTLSISFAPWCLSCTTSIDHVYILNSNERWINVHVVYLILFPFFLCSQELASFTSVHFWWIWRTRRWAVRHHRICPVHWFVVVKMCQCPSWATQMAHRSTEQIRHWAKVHPYENPAMNSNSIWIYKVCKTPSTTTKRHKFTYIYMPMEYIRLNFSCVAKKHQLNSLPFKFLYR